MPVVGPIEQIILPVRDIDAARRFYGSVLKLASIADGEDLSIYDTGQAKLIISRKGTAGAAIELGFTVDSLETAIASLIDAGARILAPPTTEPWGGRTAKITDPDGNILSLVQYP